MYVQTSRKKAIVMAVITLRVNEQEDKLIKEYADLNNVSVSSLFRDTILQKIEDEIDLQTYETAMKKYIENPQTISFDEMMKELNENE